MPTETYKIVHSDHTLYRIRPNPDCPVGEYGGIVIEHSDDGGKTWNGYFFIAPEAADEVADAIKAVAAETETEI